MNPLLEKEMNHVRLVDPETGQPGHFMLHEFESGSGLVMVQPATLWGLERVRAAVAEIVAPTAVVVIVTDGVRSDADLHILAARLGWKGSTAPDGSPGRVSRDSQHLEGKGASGVDFYVLLSGAERTRFPMTQLAGVSRRFFDYVEVYDDHVHVDQRDGGRRWARA